jgi:hypothetical protein
MEKNNDKNLRAEAATSHLKDVTGALKHSGSKRKPALLRTEMNVKILSRCAAVFKRPQK